MSTITPHINVAHPASAGAETEAPLPSTLPFPQEPPSLSYQASTQAFTGPSTAQQEWEWEYEYSATETESFHVTLDLTIPDLVQNRRPLAKKPFRNVQRIRWINSSGKNRRGGRRSVHNSVRKGVDDEEEEEDGEGEDEGDEEGVGDGDGDSDDVTPMGRSRDGEGPQSAESENEAGDRGGVGEEEGGAGEGEENEEEEKEEEEDEGNGILDNILAADPNKPSKTKDVPKDSEDDPTGKIQILELESDNPIVSYRGHTFSCSWAQNIGTELLFTKHDAERPITTLRSLPDDIDLIAATSARLISTELKLEPRIKIVDRSMPYPENEYQPVDAEGYHLPRPVKINFKNGTTEERLAQASFLERLAAIKSAKGETDDVTVYAIKRPGQKGWAAIVRNQKKGELTKLQREHAARSAHLSDLQGRTSESHFPPPPPPEYLEMEKTTIASLAEQIASLQESLAQWAEAEKAKKEEVKDTRHRRGPNTKLAQAALNNFAANAEERHRAAAAAAAVVVAKRRQKKTSAFVPRPRRAKAAARLEWAARERPRAATARGGPLRMGLSHAVGSLSWGEREPEQGGLSRPTPARWGEMEGTGARGWVDGGGGGDGNTEEAESEGDESRGLGNDDEDEDAMEV